MDGKAPDRLGLQPLAGTVAQMRKRNGYHLFLWIFGLFTMASVLFVRLATGTLRSRRGLRAQRLQQFMQTGDAARLRQEAEDEIRRKNAFFNTPMPQSELQKQVETELARQAGEWMADGSDEKDVFEQTLGRLLSRPLFAIFSFILSLPMYLLALIYRLAYVKYVMERIVMMVFVLFGVTIVVFTIIYISPTDPAASVLGPEAPKEAVESFRQVYGLNEPYHVQLWSTFRKVLTFDLGNSYVGNEDIALAITRRFPPTLQIGVLSLLVGLVIAMPAGIISAMKQYSGLDYGLMFVALLGLSIPNFWLGLLMILEFSVKQGWVPATFQPGNAITYLMPALVVGTGMSASIARMTRSSMLEVARQDYVMMARAKGLTEGKVIFRHILKNALLPIITVVGMQFAATLSGAATTEKVFNIKGMCEYIATRVLLPDTPVVIGGVIYIAAAISISNLIVDIFYTFVDPRLKTRLKNN